ncbi:MAG: zinc metallopeptidase [Coriobacteriia bacterium]|nr:zinc metallopeptidase [Coriobacteriia bacterium]MCL2606542.1 zinc metallopeptidase [Coriobacteriia bacterium]
MSRNRDELRKGFTMIFDPLWIAVMVFSMVLGGLTQFYIKSTFKKYSKVSMARPATGAQVAENTLRYSNIPVATAHGATSANAFGKRPVTIAQSKHGKLSDHFDPRSNTVALSEVVYGQSNIAAAAVAAHEVGHAVQTAKGYLPSRLRSAMVPAVNIGASFAWILIIAGLVMAMSGLVWVGIAFFALSVLFQIVTLPVELDASNRAMYMLRSTNTLTTAELAGARKVLTAAALTYVAAALVSVVQLMYWIGLARD